MAADSALEVALLLAEIFDRLEIEYLVGGSLASSLHGEPRSTQDVDFVADLPIQKAAAWIEQLGANFYVDAERVLEATRKRRSFNIVHLPTMFKADIFPASGNRANELEMARRELHRFPNGQGLWVASAEDIVLQKLLWYRLGNEVSDRQWRDVLAVLKVRAKDLDRDYLESTARELKVADLLTRALEAP